MITALTAGPVKQKYSDLLAGVLPGYTHYQVGLLEVAFEPSLVALLKSFIDLLDINHARESLENDQISPNKL